MHLKWKRYTHTAIASLQNIVRFVSFIPSCFGLTHRLGCAGPDPLRFTDLSCWSCENYWDIAGCVSFDTSVMLYAQDYEPPIAYLSTRVSLPKADSYAISYNLGYNIGPIEWDFEIFQWWCLRRRWFYKETSSIWVGTQIYNVQVAKSGANFYPSLVYGTGMLLILAWHS